MQARDCAANASFSSMTSILSSVSPACARTFLTAGTGPIPIILGVTPAAAAETTRDPAPSEVSAEYPGLWPGWARRTLPLPTSMKYSPLSRDVATSPLPRSTKPLIAEEPG